MAAIVCLASQPVLAPAGEFGAEVDDVFAPADCWCRCDSNEPIETDRHDFTQSTKTVGRGVSQLEFGYLYSYRDKDEEIEHTHVTPELVLRYGLTDKLEFQIRWNYVWRFPEGEHADDLDSAEDIRLSLKLETTEQEGWFPETAVELRGTAPTGGTAWTTDRVEVGTALIYAWELGEDWELAGSTGFATNGGGDVAFNNAQLGSDDNFTLWHQSVALGVPISERSEVYFEYYGLWTYGLADEIAQSYFNIGVDFLVSDDFVIDFRIGKGLSEDAEDFFVGAGGGLRFR